MFRMRKRTILIISVVIVLVLALSFWFVVWGIPIPWCSSYYTQTHFRDISIPDPQEFANLLQQDGWEVSTERLYDSASGYILVWATKETSVFLSKPRISVKLISYSEIYEDETEGMMSFLIYEGSGNRFANSTVFDDFVTKINDNFNLNLSYDAYNYTRYCD